MEHKKIHRRGYGYDYAKKYIQYSTVDTKTPCLLNEPPFSFAIPQRKLTSFTFHQPTEMIDECGVFAHTYLFT